MKETYKDILNRVYLERSSHKAHYSLRAFARDLKVSAPSLSLILSGKQGLSITKAKQISSALGLNSEEQKFFILSVQSLHERSAKRKARANEELKFESEQSHVLSAQEFHQLSDWYYLAILELSELKGFKSDPTWIAKRLGLNLKTVELALESLIKKSYLIRDESGELKPNTGFVSTESITPSASIRKFHTQMLKKADEAIYTQENSKRDYSALMVGCDPEDLAWVKSELKKFRRSLMKRLEKKKPKVNLYCLSMQFYELTNELKGEVK